MSWAVNCGSAGARRAVNRLRGKDYQISLNRSSLDLGCYGLLVLGSYLKVVIHVVNQTFMGLYDNVAFFQIYNSGTFSFYRWTERN